jgi:hypothetical protein
MTYLGQFEAVKVPAATDYLETTPKLRGLPSPGQARQTKAFHSKQHKLD